MALRGVNLLSATMIVAEIGDLHRFASAPQLMAYLGLVPSEYSERPQTNPGSNNQDRQRPCAARAGGGRVDVPASGAQVGAVATPGGAYRRGDPGHRLESAKAVVSALSAFEQSRQAKRSGMHRCRSRARRLHLGSRTGGASSGCGLKEIRNGHAACRQQSGQRWENPRHCYEASGNGMTLDVRARQLPDESVVMPVTNPRISD